MFQIGNPNATVLPGVRYSKGTVRKNVTVSEGTAKSLERMSLMTGLTQSHILEIALAQPMFRMTRVFANGEDDPMSLDYALGTLLMQSAHMSDRRVHDVLLREAERFVKTQARPLELEKSGWGSVGYNGYFCQTLPRFVRVDSPVFQSMYEDAAHQRVGKDLGDELKRFLLKYISEMMAHGLVYGDSIFTCGEMYMILGTLLVNSFEPHTEDELRELYQGLDDLVLKESSIMVTMF